MFHIEKYTIYGKVCMTLRKRQVHSVKSDHYISLMITSNTAEAGKVIRLHKLFLPVLSLAFLCIVGVITIFVLQLNKLNDKLNSNIADLNDKIQVLEADKADTERQLSAEISEKDSIISDLLISLEEKEEQLNLIELQAEEMWSKIEDLENIQESLYEKLTDVPLEIYDTTDTTDESASITPYAVSTSKSGYDTESVSYSAKALSISSNDFTSLYEKLLSKFSALENTIEQNYSTLNQLSDMTEAYLPYIDAIPGGYPLKDTHITCEYGYRVDPVTGKKNTFHYGIDLSAAYRQDIYSTAPGKVIFAGKSTGYGNYIIIDHGYGYTTLYAHLSKLYVKKGDVVERGTCIGGAGSTGKSTAVHLHYEVRIYGTHVDPINYLK